MPTLSKLTMSGEMRPRRICSVQYEVAPGMVAAYRRDDVLLILRSDTQLLIAPGDVTPLFSLRENAIAKEPGLSYPERWRCVS
jgi:hypothetical protein